MNPKFRIVMLWTEIDYKNLQYITWESSIIMCANLQRRHLEGLGGAVAPPPPRKKKKERKKEKREKKEKKKERKKRTMNNVKLLHIA